MTAQQRVERGRNAALARTTIDHHIRMLTGKTLTAEQRLLLSDLLSPTDAGA
jgi:hypothetical protein